MNNDSASVSRKELYDLVWSEPMTKLASKFGISDVGLKKKCRKHNIPVPPRGYWARKQVGQHPRQTPLPKESTDTTITIYRSPVRVDMPLKQQRKAGIKLKEIKKQVCLSTQSEFQHPIIEQSRKAFYACAVNRNGILERPGDVYLDLAVSPGSLERALSIMDSIIKTLERLGHQVTATETDTSAQISGCSIPFSIYEELKRRHMEPQEHELGDYYRFGHNLYSDHRVPTGAVCLTIHPPSLTNSRKNWRDTETKRLEEYLSGFIKALLSSAAAHEKDSAR